MDKRENKRKNTNNNDPEKYFARKHAAGRKPCMQQVNHARADHATHTRNQNVRIQRTVHNQTIPCM